ncbi:MAG TPA: SIR2 family protein [Allosphingosinicella sp.]
MNSTANWENETTLIGYLARQLIRGRLGIFLGAGISTFYDLPDWRTLLSELCLRNSEAPLTPSEDPVAKAGYLRAKYYADDPIRFKNDVKSALYRGKSLDFARIRQSDTLSAIGSLVMSSKRGSAAKVFTLNYDDLLENYLEFHGFTTESIWNGRHWAQNEDVVIYHPHGFLPLAAKQDSDDIILGSKQYFNIMRSPLWRPILDTALRTHTFLYIGLSMTDLHLRDLVSDLTPNHAISEERAVYHGVRFAIRGERDEIGTTLKGEGLYTYLLDDYEPGLADFLFKICQAARAERMKAA